MWRERVVRYWNPVARAAAMLGGVLWYATRDVSYSYLQAGLIATAFAGLAIGLTLEIILARIGGLRGRALAASGGISLALCLAAVAWIELNGTFSSSEMGSGAWWTGSYWYVVLVIAAVLIAAYLEPDVLLVDEVLAVGDASFQQRCLDKLRDMLANGTTLVFVSHDLAAVEASCRRGVLLEDGRVTVEESELLRAAAAVLGCPVPPGMAVASNE